MSILTKIATAEAPIGPNGVRLPAAASVRYNPSAAELQELTSRMPQARRTSFGNYNVQTKVTSRSVVTANGEMKTLGIMHPGAYRFTTEGPESIEVTQGHCRVKLDDDQNWSEYGPGESFALPANSHFEIEVDAVLDYVCHYG